jgi:hypothetical protein
VSSDRWYLLVGRDARWTLTTLSCLYSGLGQHTPVDHNALEALRQHASLRTITSPKRHRPYLLPRRRRCTSSRCCRGSLCRISQQVRSTREDKGAYLYDRTSTFSGVRIDSPYRGSMTSVNFQYPRHGVMSVPCSSYSLQERDVVVHKIIVLYFHLVSIPCLKRGREGLG